MVVREAWPDPRKRSCPELEDPLTVELVAAQFAWRGVLWYLVRFFSHGRGLRSAAVLRSRRRGHELADLDRRDDRRCVFLGEVPTAIAFGQQPALHRLTGALERLVNGGA